MPNARKNNNHKGDTEKGANETARAARVSADETVNVGHQATVVAADFTRRGAEMMQQSMQMAADVAGRSVDQFAGTFGFSSEDAEQAAQQASENINAVADCSTYLAQGVQDISKEWMTLAQSRLQKNMEGFSALLRCRTPQDFFAAQGQLIRDNLEEAVNNSRRIAEMSVQVAGDAAEKMAVAGKGKGRARRAA